MFAFSTVANKRDTKPRRVEVPWESFVRTMKNTDVRNQKDGPAWLPATFNGKGRVDADVEAITACVLDIDHNNVTAQHIASVLNGFEYIAHTTYSSTAEDLRWRITIPLAKPVAPTKTPALFDHFNAKFGNLLDPACKNPSRIHYLPSCPPDRLPEHQFVQRPGKTFDASALPDTPIVKSKQITPAAEIPARFAEDLKTDTKLQLVWGGADTGLDDNSRSGRDMQLVGMLVCRDYADPEIAAILFAFEHGKAPQAGLKYIARTVAKARQNVPQPPTPPEPTTTDTSSVIFRCVAEIPAEYIHWLWQGRIARGKLSLIVGNPGEGKSQIAAHIAAITTTGGKFPDGMSCEAGNVIILSAEDDAADTLKPRLEAAGADLTKVFILDAVREIPPYGAIPLERPFNLGRDIPRLEEAIVRIGDVALVIVDPISAYLGNIDSHRNSEVRALLMPLGTMAAKADTAILGVTHMTKGSNNDALMRVTGSLAFVAAARAAYVVVAAKENPERHLFLPLKNNIGKNKSGFVYTIEDHRVHLDGKKNIEASRVVWDKEPISMSADEAMAKEKKDPQALTQAMTFLHKLLGAGPVSVKQIEADAHGAGHSWATVRRAKEELAVKAKKSGGPKGGWTWELNF